MMRLDSTDSTSASINWCNACGGTGYQTNQVTGINELCPVCGGSGRKIAPLYIW